MIKEKKLSRHERSKIRDSKLKAIDKFLTPYFCFIKYDEVRDKASKILGDRYNKIWYTDSLEQIVKFAVKDKNGIIQIRDNYSSFASLERLVYYFCHMGILAKLNNSLNQSILPQIRNAYIDNCFDIYIHNIKNDDVVDKMLLCANYFYQEYANALDELYGATVINCEEYEQEKNRLPRLTRIK